MTQIYFPLCYGKVGKGGEDVDDIEELRHLSFKEYKGSREVKEKCDSGASESYQQPLKL
jgi:hypothetical protein